MFFFGVTFGREILTFFFFSESLFRENSFREIFCVQSKQFIILMIMSFITFCIFRRSLLMVSTDGDVPIKSFDFLDENDNIFM